MSIYERMKQDIVLGILQPGMSLIEVSLAERYSVSRTPVREALRRLEQDGLVERADRGMIVRRHTAEEIFEHYSVRMILEGAAAQMAANNRTEFDVSRLTAFLSSPDGPDLPVEERVQLDREFHHALWRASHNRTLFDTLERLYTNSVRYLSTTLSGDDRWRRSSDEHRQIVDAIVRGDDEEASALIIEHLRRGRDIHVSHMTAMAVPGAV